MCSNTADIDLRVRKEQRCAAIQQMLLCTNSLANDIFRCCMTWFAMYVSTKQQTVVDGFTVMWNAACGVLLVEPCHWDIIVITVSSRKTETWVQGALGLSGGAWSANWQITKSTKCVHLLRRLMDIGAVPNCPASQVSPTLA